MWQLDSHGWLLPGPHIWLKPSPNCDERPANTEIELLVLHNISLPPGQFKTPHIADLFLNKLDVQADPWFVNIVGLRVSAHFVIERDGTTTQFVAINARGMQAYLLTPVENAATIFLLASNSRAPIPLPTQINSTTRLRT
jgi:AmpD protein